MRLWYKQPAREWTQALPLGNGRIGAMVYGKPVNETISLNEDTLWSGYPRNTLVPGAAEGIQKATALVGQKNYKQAGEVLDREVLGPYTQSYLPFGDLRLDFAGFDAAEIKNYTRALDLKNAIHTTSFEVDGVRYERECFVSAADQVMVIRLTASVSEKLNLALHFDCQLHHESAATGNTLVLKGVAPSYVAPSYLRDIENPIVYEEAPAKKGMRFLGEAVVLAEGGQVTAEDGTLAVSRATTVEIRVFLQTSFNGFDKPPFTQGIDETAALADTKKACMKKPYEGLKQEHIQDYQGYYNRVEFSLQHPQESMPTDERLRRFQKSQNDPHLYELMFQYGRYLTICASRPGTQATNLQGIWNQHLRAPWSSNYTVNINTEMNYWPTECANLSECHTPLFKLIQNIAVTGQETAKAYYHARGSVCHHNTDIWALSTPVGENNPGLYGCSFWNMSFGWLTRHLYEHYEYTLDKAFLKEVAYPAIKAAAMFYMDCLVRDENGNLSFGISTSPENAFLYEGEVVKVSRFTTMSNAIIREVFDHVLRCCEILETDTAFAEEVLATKQQLPPYKIGSAGQMLEWEEAFEEPEVHHRHISHLYCLYPAWEGAPCNSETLANACKRSLEIRGDVGTGWSLGWKINAWARLREGDHALQLLKNQLRFVDDDAQENYQNGGGTYANLMDAHPPFQIDGNFAACAGLCEMMVQSSGRDVYLLPALSQEIGTGFVKGLRIKNGLQMDIYFENGNLTEAVFRSTVAQKRNVRFHYKDALVEREIEKENILLTANNFKNEV